MEILEQMVGSDFYFQKSERDELGTASQFHLEREISMSLPSHQILSNSPSDFNGFLFGQTFSLPLVIQRKSLLLPTRIQKVL
ncbi:MAG: hypothetical protein NT040_11205 [Bacteroidetes bacterium]|nr:hypothetical protein [Bacteroidota bacterium]